MTSPNNFTNVEAEEYLKRISSYAPEYLKEKECLLNYRVKCYHEHRGHCCFAVSQFWWFITHHCVFDGTYQKYCVGFTPVIVPKEPRSGDTS